MRDTVESMHPGDPQCSPASAVMAEALTALMRTLHRSEVWRASINGIILSRLQLVGKLANLLSAAEPEPTVGMPNVTSFQETEKDDDAKNQESTSSLVITNIDASPKKKKDAGGY